MVRFTKEQDELLIESVKLNRILFDASDKDHKNNVLKHKRWEEISLVVGLEVSDCKKRWKSLRDQFNKKKRGESTGAERTNSSWEYMSIMSFLLDTDERRETITNLEEQRAVNEVQNKDEERQGDQQNEEEQLSQQNEGELRYQQSEEQQPIGEEISKDDFLNADEITVPQNKRRATKKNSSEPLMKIFAKRDAQRSALYDKIINKPSEHKTPMQKFFESMADIADKLPSHLQAEIRLKVCQIVTDTEIKHLTQHVQYPNLQSSLFNQFSSTQYPNTPNSQHSSQLTPSFHQFSNIQYPNTPNSQHSTQLTPMPSDDSNWTLNSP